MESIRRNVVQSWLLPLAVSLLVGVMGCGGGSSGSITQNTAQGLWVPNFLGASVTAFSSKLLKSSGTPAATITNENDVMVQPEQVLFDKKGNLWITNCSDSTIGAGTIAKYTAHQVSQFSTNPSPNPEVLLTDDGSFNIFDCPYGEAFDSNGNLWVTNRFGLDLVEFTPSQLAVGGAQIPNTIIFSDDFGAPEGIQFDTSGTLWIADLATSQILGFKAATLTAAEGTSTIVSPDIVNSSTSLDAPADVLVEKSGNQWIANFGGNNLLEFAATDVAASGSPSPIVTLSGTTVMAPTGPALSLDSPQGLAFDKSGNLWASNALSDNEGSVAEFTHDQIATSGSPTPKVFLDSDPDGLNMDDPALISFGRNIK
jgi:secreted PhoX family phosphatase